MTTCSAEATGDAVDVVFSAGGTYRLSPSLEPGVGQGQAQLPAWKTSPERQGELPESCPWAGPL